MNFVFEPQVIQNLDAPNIRQNIANSVGDIRQPWIDVGRDCGVSEFAAKALFAIGMMRRYILSANLILRDMNYSGFLSAYGLFSSGVELLGRCVHSDRTVRQHPSNYSMERLTAGFEYLKNPRLQPDVIVETNHYVDANGGYDSDDLKNLRNLVIHGACISRASSLKADVELMHNLRVLFYGIPIGEPDPHLGPGPQEGALDKYFSELYSGDQVKCDRLASAGISPSPTNLQGGNWPFSTQIVNEIKNLIDQNLSAGRLPVSGTHTKDQDYFQLFPSRDR